MTVEKKLSVSAIKNGTVIDHVPAQCAMKIIRLLKLDQLKFQITLGLNLPSKRYRSKDLIKIENKLLSEREANQVAIFAPKATINIIEDFKVVKKIPIHIPEVITDIFLCPNSRCITQTEPIETCFYVEANAQQMKLKCKYCEKQFGEEQMREVP